MPSPLQIFPIPGIPEIREGDDLAACIIAAAAESNYSLQSGDVVVLAQKIVSKAEGRRVRLDSVTPTARAMNIAAVCGKDPRLVELVLSESDEVVRCAPDVLIVRHRIGFTVANAGIDQSNVDGTDECALLLPKDPDQSAAILQTRLSEAARGPIGVVINDSFGRPWRRGTCGIALGCAGVEALADLRGIPDRFGRILRTSEVATADEIAAAASLAMGQAAEGRPAVIVRGLPVFERARPAADLIRPRDQDLFK